MVKVLNEMARMTIPDNGVSFAGLAGMSDLSGIKPLQFDDLTFDSSKPEDIEAALRTLDLKFDEYMKEFGNKPKVIETANQIKEQCRMFILSLGGQSANND